MTTTTTGCENKPEVSAGCWAVFLPRLLADPTELVFALQNTEVNTTCQEKFSIIPDWAGINTGTNTDANNATKRVAHATKMAMVVAKSDRSVQAGPMWQFRSDFPSCSEFAEICYADSFCVKKCPCVFFSKKEQKYGQNWVKIPPPPPSLSLCPSPNNLGFQS